MAAETIDPAVRDALARRPDTAWVRGGLALFGWGVAARVEAGSGADRFDRALRRLSATAAPMAMASFTFDENDPGSSIVVPRAMMRIDGDGARFVIGDESMVPPPSQPVRLPAGCLARRESAAWEALVGEALAAIRDNEVDKVVLSRIVTAGFDASVPAHQVLSNLVRNEAGSHTYLVDGFLGSSPELLLSLQEAQVRSISLAGSADPTAPEADGLFQSEKMTREHSLAADSVDLALAPFCSHLERSERGVATYGDIQHLSTTFEGVTHPGTTFADLLAAMHPTAAVAGTPTKSALELIRELESHKRGRYAGPVGWFDRSGEGEFAIALRCGKIDGATVTLYTGAGIVEGSDPAQEFDETEIKLRPMLGALGLS
ncbi:MAG TPA: isochorismate synthase [Acidimicrobiia bacterium]|nr:isochorismate synthase [Acidimicrobiia bacterium]